MGSRFHCHLKHKVSNEPSAPRWGAIEVPRMRGVGKLKYIVHWEFCPEDMDKCIAKNKKAAEITKKEPDRFAKNLFPPQYTGSGKGFSLVEVTDPEQFNNAQVYWFPEMKLKYVPCDDVSKWIELYMKSK